MNNSEISLQPTTVAPESEKLSSPQEKSLTKFCQAVVDYLSSKDLESFRHCVNVCHKIIGPSLWTTGDEPATTTDFNGERPTEFARHQRTRAFVEDFLLQHLTPYRNFNHEDLEAAALDGAFRYWPLECLRRLQDQVRKTYRESYVGPEDNRRPRIEPHGLGPDLERKFYPGDGGYGDIDSATSHTYAPEPLEYAPVMRRRSDLLNGAPVYRLDAEALRSWYAEKSPALNALLDESLQQTFKVIVEAGAPQDAEQTQAVAEAKGVSERTARAHIAQLAGRLKEIIRSRAELFEDLAESSVVLAGYRDHRGHRVKNVMN